MSQIYCMNSGRRPGSQEKAEEVPYQQRAVQEHGYLILRKYGPIRGLLCAHPALAGRPPGTAVITKQQS